MKKYHTLQEIWLLSHASTVLHYSISMCHIWQVKVALFKRNKRKYYLFICRMFPTVAYDRCKVRFKFVTKLRVFFTIIIAREYVILSDDRKSLDYSLCMYACDCMLHAITLVLRSQQVLSFYLSYVSNSRIWQMQSKV